MEEELNNRAEETIIILDNGELNHKGFLKMNLTGEGYNVTVATNGFELMSALHSCEPRLLLLDVDTKWVSCLDLCQKMKESEKFKSVKIIFFMEDEIDEEEKNMWIHSGCDDFVEKPYAMTSLVEKIIGAIGEAAAQS